MPAAETSTRRSTRCGKAIASSARDEAAHRVADDRRRVDPELVEQPVEQCARSRRSRSARRASASSRSPAGRARSRGARAAKTGSCSSQFGHEPDRPWTKTSGGGSPRARARSCSRGCRRRSPSAGARASRCPASRAPVRAAASATVVELVDRPLSRAGVDARVNAIAEARASEQGACAAPRRARLTISRRCRRSTSAGDDAAPIAAARLRRPGAADASAAWRVALALLEEDLRRRDAAPRTRRAYARRPRAVRALGERRRAARRRDVEPKRVRRYVAMLSERGAAPSTCARKLAALRALFASQREHGLIAQNPADLVSTPRRGSHLPRVLQRARGRARCSTAIPAGGPLELRDRAMFELAYACGLRAEELVSLQHGRRRPRRRAAARRGQGSQDALRAGRRAGAGWRCGAISSARAVTLSAATPASGGSIGRRAVPLEDRPARSARATCGGGCAPGPRRRASASAAGGGRSRRTRCATASRRTCSTAAPTCAASRSCSATRACPAPRFTLG